MPRSLAASTFFAVSLALAFAAFAEDAAMPMPTPSKELEAFMKPMEGTWKCDSKMAAGSMGPGSPEMISKSTVKISKEMGGMWYRGEWSQPKSKTAPAMSGVFMMGWDPGASQVVQMSWDSMGGSGVGTGTISGTTMTQTGEGTMMGKKMKMKETVTRVDDKTMTHKAEADMGKGFQPMGEDSCKK